MPGFTKPNPETKFHKLKELKVNTAHGQLGEVVNKVNLPSDFPLLHVITTNRNPILTAKPMGIKLKANKC